MRRNDSVSSNKSRGQGAKRINKEIDKQVRDN